MKYAFIAQQKKAWPIDRMCQVLGVKRNGYYGFQKRIRHRHEDSGHQALLRCIQEIDVRRSGHSYGSRRMRVALSEQGYALGRHRARNLIKEAGVWVRYRKKYKVTTKSDHGQPTFDNLLNRRFKVEQPNQVYVSDITYLWTSGPRRVGSIWPLCWTCIPEK